MGAGAVVVAQPVHEGCGAPPGGGPAHLRQVAVVPLALQPLVEREGFAEAELHREDGEPAALSEKAQHPLACERELFDEVGALSDRDNPGVADDFPEPFEVIEGLLWIKRGQGVECSRNQSASTVHFSAWSSGHSGSSACGGQAT